MQLEERSIALAPGTILMHNVAGADGRRVLKKGTLLNEKHVDMKELRRRLTTMKLRQKTGDDKVVLLEAAGNVTYQTYFDVMASISDAGGVTAILQEE